MFDRERQLELMGLYGANSGTCKSCDARVRVSDSSTLIPKIIHGSNKDTDRGQIDIDGVLSAILV